MHERHRRATFWAVIGAAVSAGLAFSFWPQPVSVDLATLTRGDMTVTVDEEGETRVRDVYVISSPVAGRALRIDAEVGDRVSAGTTVVARIEPNQPTFLDPRSLIQARAEIRAAESAHQLAAAEVVQAEAELEFAVTDLERKQQLARRDAIPHRELDDAERIHKIRRAALDTARAALRMRDSELARSRALLVSPADTVESGEECDCVTLRSPIDGVVLRVVHKSEGVVAAAQPLVEVGDPARLEIVADFLSADAVQIRTGLDVIIDEWGGDQPLGGIVRRIEPTAETRVSALGIEEQRVDVIVDLVDPPSAVSALGHGFRVEVRVVLWRGSGVLRLPLSAAFRNGGGWAVYVEDGGRARVRPVSLGHRDGFVAEVLDGLEAGERVVLHPSDRLSDGVRVTQR
jgi:HlyD family secretion protein